MFDISIGLLFIKFGKDLTAWTLGQICWSKGNIGIAFLCFYVHFWW